MTYDVTLIPGDGIGPEITAQTVQVLEATGLRFNWDEELAGMAAVEATGTPLPDATVESIRKNAARPQGAAHHAGRHRLPLGERRAPQGIRALRQRPPRPYHRARRPVRERGHRAGAGEPRGALHRGRALRRRSATTRAPWANRWRSSPARGCERIVRYAFEYALKHGRKKVTIVHKANILKMVSGLFLEVGRAIAKEYEGRVESNDMIVDNTAMQLVMRPEQFDVMVTTNMFGDILSDEVSGLVGGLGLAPGANIGTKAAIFEAVHGSAPDIAGKGIANPSAQMLAAAMMLDHLGRAGPGRADPATPSSTPSCRTGSAPATSAAPPPPRSSGDAVARRVA